MNVKRNEDLFKADPKILAKLEEDKIRAICRQEIVIALKVVTGELLK